jgi:hypothetical protein
MESSGGASIVMVTGGYHLCWNIYTPHTRTIRSLIMVNSSTHFSVFIILVFTQFAIEDNFASRKTNVCSNSLIVAGCGDGLGFTIPFVVWICQVRFPRHFTKMKLVLLQ